MVSRIEELVAATGGRWADLDDTRRIGDDRIARVRVFLGEAQATRAARDQSA